MTYHHILAIFLAVCCWPCGFARAGMPPLAAEAFMATTAKEMGSAKYQLADGYTGAGATRLHEVLARFAKAGVLGKSRFYVMDVPYWNAFASAGMAAPDVICVFSGLLNEVHSADELAGVLGHELAHNQHHDALDEMTQLALSGLLSYALFGYARTDRVGYFLGFMHLGFSRSHEARADRNGLVNAVKAGYDPRATVTLWQRMAKNYPDHTQRMLMDHPHDLSRAAQLQQVVDRHFRQDGDGHWTVLSPPRAEDGANDFTHRLRRGGSTALHSGLVGAGVGLVSLVTEDARPADVARDTAQWAGAGLLTGFLLETDFPPSLSTQVILGKAGTISFGISVIRSRATRRSYPCATMKVGW